MSDYENSFVLENNGIEYDVRQYTYKEKGEDYSSQIISDIFDSYSIDIKNGLKKMSVDKEGNVVDNLKTGSIFGFSIILIISFCISFMVYSKELLISIKNRYLVIAILVEGCYNLGIFI